MFHASNMTLFEMHTAPGAYVLYAPGPYGHKPLIILKNY